MKLNDMRFSAYVSTIYHSKYITVTVMYILCYVQKPMNWVVLQAKFCPKLQF